MPRALAACLAVAGFVGACRDPTPARTDHFTFLDPDFVVLTPDGRAVPLFRRADDQARTYRARGEGCEPEPCEVVIVPADPPDLLDAGAFAGLEVPGPWPATARAQTVAGAVELRVWTTLAPEDTADARQNRSRSVTTLDRLTAPTSTLSAWSRLALLRELADRHARTGAGALRRAADANARAAALAGDLGAVLLAARFNLSAAYGSIQTSSYARALAQIQRARASAPLTGEYESSLLASADYFEGLVAAQTGDRLRAARLLEGALSRLQSGSDAKFKLGPLQMLAHVNSELGRHGDALGLLDRLLRNLDASPEAPALTRVRLKVQSSIGMVKLRAARAGALAFGEDDIIAHLAPLPAAFEELELPASRDLAWQNLAIAHYALGDPDRAHEASSRIGTSTTSFGIEELRQLRAEVALARDGPTVARPLFEAALREASRDSDGEASEWTWRARYALARIDARAGRTEAAAREYRRALEDRRAAAARASLQEARATYLSDRQQLVADAIGFFLAAGDAASAFEVADAERASVLRELDTDARRSRLSPDEAQQLAGLIGAYQTARRAYDDAREQAERGFRRRSLATRTDANEKARSPNGAAPDDAPSTDDPRAFVARLQTLRREKQRRFDEVYAFLDEHAAYEALPTPTVEELRERLGPGEVIVTAAQAADPERSFGYGSAPLDRERTTRLIGFVLRRAGLEARPLRGEAPSILSELGEERESGPGRVEHVYVVPDGAGRLRNAHTSSVGTSLLQRASLSYLPYAGLLAGNATGAGAAVVVVADPEGDLPHARDEAARLRDVFPEAEIPMGTEATRERAMEALSGVRLFHFAGHGVLNPNSAWDAHLRLADGDRLALEDLLVTRPSAQVVVLNGCETGQTVELGKSFGLGLADAFLLVGAQAVLATDRPVKDEDARAFVEAFYAHGGAERPAAAFRTAALAAEARGLRVWRDYRLFGRRLPGRDDRPSVDGVRPAR